MAETTATGSAPSPPTETTATEKTTTSKKFDQQFYRDWCKACGICMALCPVGIIDRDDEGKPVVTEPDRCIGCRTCEVHCPDFAITITERHPRRRKENGHQ